MDLIEQLNTYKEKINKALNIEEVKDLISVELFDLIFENSNFREEFYKHSRYFYNLAKNTEFVKLQNNLFEEIVKILEITNLEQVKDLELKTGNALDTINHFNYALDGKISLTISELYSVLKDKKNYCQLVANENFPEDIPNASILEQYGIAEHIFKKLDYHIFKNDKKLSEQLTQAAKNYDDFWYEFNKLINREAIKLNVKAFRDFFLFCVQCHEFRGYEMWYQHLHGEELPTYYGYGDIKNDCNVVIDGLINAFQVDLKIIVNEENLINISGQKGIYRFRFGKELAYPIGGVAFKLVKLLTNSLQNGHKRSFLMGQLSKDSSYLTNTVKRINKLCKTELKFSDDSDFIIPAREGYRLNTDKFEIKLAD